MSSADEVNRTIFELADNFLNKIPVEKLNANNTYKDRIRTWELEARIAMNKK